MSYRTVPNMKNIISGHNNKIVNPQVGLGILGCNCQNGVQNCMLGGNCLTRSLVYRAELKYQIQNPRTGILEPKTKYYIGLTSTSFKERYKTHKTSFNHAAYKSSTTLSSHIWNIREKNVQQFDLNFSILKLCRTYTKESKSCDLCLAEKTYIMFSNHYLQTDHFSTLNRRSELMQKCLHRARHLLESW